MITNKYEIVARCQELVDLQLFTGQNHTLCLDGTSCTKKSSILNATGASVSKVQKTHNFSNCDSFFPSMIGYICRGMETIRCGGKHLNDRSPLNVIEWHVLWSIMNDYVVRIGNRRPTEDDKEIMNEYRQILLLFKNSYYYKKFRSEINTVVLIDSNVDRCDELHLIRKSSVSDLERGHWMFYTVLQNEMYKTLYPGACIDIAEFDAAPSDQVVEGIAHFLKNTLDFICETRPCKPPPLVDCKLPVVKIDYTLMNMETHVYRSIGRWGCRLIANQNADLESYIPPYVEVENITAPQGCEGPSKIYSKPFKHLIVKRKDNHDYEMMEESAETDWDSIFE